MSGAIKEGTCATTSNKGIIKLQGNITDSILSSITNNSSPFTISFGPKTIKPFIMQNLIYDSNSDNTITYKVNKYTLSDIQYCKTVNHTGYWLNRNGTQQNPIAELYITFTAKNINEINGNYPASVVLVFPIYLSTSNIGDHDAYLRQLAVSSAPVASLQTLFYKSETDQTQKSLSYDMCFNFETNRYINLTFFIFPVGISLTQDIITNFNSIPTRGYKLLTMYDIPIGSTPILISSENFTNTITFYEKPPQLPGKFSNDQCEYYKTSQYKCVPFDKLRDLSGDYVVANGNPLNTVISSQQAVKANIPSSNIDSLAVKVIGGITGSIVVLGAVLGVAKLVMNLQKEETPENNTNVVIGSPSTK